MHEHLHTQRGVNGKKLKTSALRCCDPISTKALYRVLPETQ